jgi:HAD superfamily hydrolase (TIGR01509 family)
MNQIKAVIFDLDGTLIQTETLILDIARQIVAQHGRELTEEAIEASLGRSPIDAWTTVARILCIDAPPQSLLDEAEPMLMGRWHQAGLLPGAARVLRHLSMEATPKIALATSSSRATLHRKLSSKPELQDIFHHIQCGDDGQCPGKPAPDCFLLTAEALRVDPSECLVIEDAPCGVQAAIAAGMRVVVVPSLHDTSAYPTHDNIVEVLPSLLSFEPHRYGFSPFMDYIAGTIPLDPVWRISGKVVKGFGRGSKELGIPTANLDAVSLRGALAEAVTGIYAGWASIGGDGEVYPMCMSVGWNPVFGNKEKTCEPWILNDFKGRSFYGVELRLVAVTFIRPESNFPSIDDLVRRIHKDAEMTKEALHHEKFAVYRKDPFLCPSAC